jgi:hypothetical protein
VLNVVTTVNCTVISPLTLWSIFDEKISGKVEISVLIANFGYRNQNSNVKIEIGIEIPILKSAPKSKFQYRYRNRNSDFDIEIKIGILANQNFDEMYF